MIIGDKNDAWCYLKNDLDFAEKSEANVIPAWRACYDLLKMCESQQISPACAGAKCCVVALTSECLR